MMGNLGNRYKISVIVPIYNKAAYIERCAISLFEQTLEDIEYIFVNDNTPDDAVDILQKVVRAYPSREPHVQIYNLPQNIGLPSVRKFGIAKANGEFIANCDSDDWVAPTMYQEMYELAKLENHDIVRCNFARTDGVSSINSYDIDLNHYNDKTLLYSDLLRGYDLNSVCDKIIKRDLFVNNRIIYPTLNMLEDFVITAQVLYLCNSVGYINKSLYFYYTNPASISKLPTKQAVKSRFEQKVANVNIILDFVDKKNLCNIYKKELLILRNNVLGELLPYISDKEFYYLWKTAYPEISILTLPGMKLKIKWLIIYCHLYPIIKRLFF